VSAVPPTEWDAATYHRISAPQLAWGRRVLDRLPLRGDERVLDAGCGTGRLTAELLARLPRGSVVAVDASAAMAGLARAELARFGGRVEILRADLLDLRLPHPVDAILSNAVFHHVPDHPRLFRVLAAVLRPGGLLVAQCGGGANLARVRAHVAGAVGDDPLLSALAGWDPGEYADAPTTAVRLREAGFTAIRTAVHAAPVRFDDAGTLRTHLRTVTLRSHLARIPPGARERLLDLVVAACAADRPPLTLDHWRLDIDATRAPPA
jgi:SAM-dependent methyltransferase